MDFCPIGGAAGAGGWGDAPRRRLNPSSSPTSLVVECRFPFTVAGESSRVCAAVICTGRGSRRQDLETQET